MTTRFLSSFFSSECDFNAEDVIVPLRNDYTKLFDEFYKAAVDYLVLDVAKPRTESFTNKLSEERIDISGYLADGIQSSIIKAIGIFGGQCHIDVIKEHVAKRFEDKFGDVFYLCDNFDRIVESFIETHSEGTNREIFNRVPTRLNWWTLGPYAETIRTRKKGLHILKEHEEAQLNMIVQNTRVEKKMREKERSKEPEIGSAELLLNQQTIAESNSEFVSPSIEDVKKEAEEFGVVPPTEMSEEEEEEGEEGDTAENNKALSVVKREVVDSENIGNENAYLRTPIIGSVKGERVEKISTPTKNRRLPKDVQAILSTPTTVSSSSSSVVEVFVGERLTRSGRKQANVAANSNVPLLALPDNSYKRSKKNATIQQLILDGEHEKDEQKEKKKRSYRRRGGRRRVQVKEEVESEEESSANEEAEVISNAKQNTKTAKRKLPFPDDVPKLKRARKEVTEEFDMSELVPTDHVRASQISINLPNTTNSNVSPPPIVNCEENEEESANAQKRRIVRKKKRGGKRNVRNTNTRSQESSSPNSLREERENENEKEEERNDEENSK